MSNGIGYGTFYNFEEGRSRGLFVSLDRRHF
uniref:Uncharacterized protein n=1 Tax=Rhizophora mucronata TaxID=61149 RepID=A0A2P2IXN8_RHIMU